METQFTEIDIFNLIDMFCYRFRALVQKSRNDACLSDIIANGDKHILNQLFKDWFLTIDDYRYIPSDDVAKILNCMMQDKYIGGCVPDL